MPWALPQETVTYAYDRDGNRTTRTTAAGAETATYAYDADGNRVEAVESGATTRYLVLCPSLRGRSRAGKCDQSCRSDPRIRSPLKPARAE